MLHDASFHVQTTNCTTGEDEVEEGGERGRRWERTAVSLDVMQKHVRRCFTLRLTVCGAKPSHHSSQMIASHFHGACLCTTREDEVEGGGERGRKRKRAAVSLDVIQKHVRRCFTL